MKKIISINTKTLLLCICLLGHLSTHAQIAVLKSVHENRLTGQTLLYKEKYDSACIALARFVDNNKYSNPYDHLNYSLCHYKLKDTTRFLKHLDKAIEGGVDTTRIRSYLRKLTGSDKSFLENHLAANYYQLRKKGWAQYDTALIKEANSIEDLDQFARHQLMKMPNGQADSNFNYLLFLGKQSDSINYVRVARLMKAGRFPGYHNCGAFASLTIVLIHLGDTGEDNWEYLFAQLKKEVLAGNIMPLEVATIVDNHYQRGRGKLCSYYGQWTGRTTELCDCAQVDKNRDIIGLQDLQSEYKLKGKAIPECYSPKQIK